MIKALPASEDEKEEREAKAAVYHALANGLIKQAPLQSLLCHQLAHWETFAYLWEPRRDPPSDEYTVTLYKVACEKFIHAFRQIYAFPNIHQFMGIDTCREVHKFWKQAWPEKVPPDLPCNLSELLENKEEKTPPSDRSSTPYNNYKGLMNGLFPPPPKKYSDMSYAKRAEKISCNQKYCHYMYAKRDQIIEYLKCNIQTP